MLDRPDIGHDAATTGTAGQGDVELLIDVFGDPTVSPRMSLGTPRPFLETIRDFLGIGSSGGGRPAGGLAIGLVESVAESLIFGLKPTDELFKPGDANGKGFGGRRVGAFGFRANPTPQPA